MTTGWEEGGGGGVTFCGWWNKNFVGGGGEVAGRGNEQIFDWWGDSPIPSQ